MKKKQAPTPANADPANTSLAAAAPTEQKTETELQDLQNQLNAGNQESEKKQEESEQRKQEKAENQRKGQLYTFFETAITRGKEVPYLQARHDDIENLINAINAINPKITVEELKQISPDGKKFVHGIFKKKLIAPIAMNKLLSSSTKKDYLVAY